MYFECATIATQDTAQIHPNKGWSISAAIAGRYTEPARQSVADRSEPAAAGRLLNLF